jgi:hypothetical protein
MFYAEDGLCNRSVGLSKYVVMRCGSLSIMTSYTVPFFYHLRSLIKCFAYVVAQCGTYGNLNDTILLARERRQLGTYHDGIMAFKPYNEGNCQSVTICFESIYCYLKGTELWKTIKYSGNNIQA